LSDISYNLVDIMATVASQTSSRPAAKRPRTAGALPRKPPFAATAAAAKKTPPVPAAMNGVSPFEIMAARIANRVAEMAENVSFVERPVYVVLISSLSHTILLN
jgi:hypothetical protein